MYQSPDSQLNIFLLLINFWTSQSKWKLYKTVYCVTETHNFTISHEGKKRNKGSPWAGNLAEFTNIWHISYWVLTVSTFQAKFFFSLLVWYGIYFAHLKFEKGNMTLFGGWVSKEDMKLKWGHIFTSYISYTYTYVCMCVHICNLLLSSTLISLVFLALSLSLCVCFFLMPSALYFSCSHLQVRRHMWQINKV